METEDNTFKTLKQIPLLDMWQLVSELTASKGNSVLSDTIYSTNSSVITRIPYSTLDYHRSLIILLSDNGWTFDEFVTEVEKETLMDAIKKFNDSMSMPKDIVRRAKRFFPNAEFIEARIDFKD